MAGPKPNGNKPTAPGGGKKQSPPPSAQDKSLTLSWNEERMETEPLPQREVREGVGDMPVESSPRVDVESTPMEVATEELRSHD